MKTMDTIHFRAIFPSDLLVKSSPLPLMWENINKHPSLFWRKNKYHIYSSEYPGVSFNLGFLKGGAYSREALIEYIRKTLNTFNLSL